jgi:transcriptional regulator with XRE-family HTH domain
MTKSPTTVSRWCNNEMQPSLETLVEIAMKLDVDVRDLLNPTK